jgi:adenylate cyclase class 2
MNTNQEVEAKFYIQDLTGIQMRLRSLEALLIQDRVLETNIRFDLPDGGLRSEGHVLRLRQDTDARLTYKGAGTNQQGVLSRTEIEFTVDDFGKAKLFIEALGYQKFFYYEKYRTVFDLDGCHIMLDELPYGNFVEIEGNAIDSIQAVANKLSLQWERAIPTGYHLLFEEMCKRHPDLDSTDLSFSTLKGLNITAKDLSVHAADE